jgi:hypothetical protein
VAAVLLPADMKAVLLAKILAADQVAHTVLQKLAVLAL